MSDKNFSITMFCDECGEDVIAWIHPSDISVAECLNCYSLLDTELYLDEIKERLRSQHED